MDPVRAPAVAGTFYPGKRAALESMVTRLLTEARAETPAGAPVPKALVVPHAGYVYSGPTAALGYARLEPARATIHRVVLLGPVHHVPIRGLALPGAAAMRTPLGDVPVDAAPDVLPGLRQVSTSIEAHHWEHSLEVHLPFLQSVLDAFRVVPLVVGQATPEEVAEVIDALWGGPETLVVISSDLSHYHPYAEANRIDAATVAQLLALSGPIDHLQACGAYAANGLLVTARRRGMQAELYDHRNSGDTAGDKDRVVGYASIGFRESA